jgi:DNA-binding transcriptional LysR family regulator
MDRLRAIEIFSEVARGRSFSAAAQRLGMAKGNVTKHVAWLEEMLGAQLLTRTTKSVSLTEAGLTLLEGGQDLLDRFELVGEAVRGALKAPKGTIRVGTPPSFGAVHLVPMVTAFSSIHPGIQTRSVPADRAVAQGHQPRWPEAGQRPAVAGRLARLPGSQGGAADTGRVVGP